MDCGVQRKMREERVGDAESKLKGGGGCLQNVTLGLGLRKKHVIYTFFFLMVAGLNRFGSVRFNRFQTLKTETEPNRIFFVIFQSVNSVFFFGSVFLVVFYSVLSV
jgi:hypothetical protein